MPQEAVSVSLPASMLPRREGNKGSQSLGTQPAPLVRWSKLASHTSRTDAASFMSIPPLHPPGV